MRLVHLLHGPILSEHGQNDQDDTDFEIDELPLNYLKITPVPTPWIDRQRTTEPPVQPRSSWLFIRC